MVRLGPVHKETLAQGPHWMKGKLLKYHGVEIVVTDPIRWLLSKNDGLFLLRLLVKNNRFDQPNDHLICVDVGAREILDSVEKFAIHLRNDATALRVGDGFVLKEVAEFRRIE